jgi:hypothetical protein
MVEKRGFFNRRVAGEREMFYQVLHRFPLVDHPARTSHSDLDCQADSRSLPSSTHAFRDGSRPVKSSKTQTSTAIHCVDLQFRAVGGRARIAMTILVLPCALIACARPCNCSDTAFDYCGSLRSQQLLQSTAVLATAMVLSFAALHLLRRASEYPLSSDRGQKFAPGVRILKYETGARLFHWTNPPQSGRRGRGLW